MTGTPVVELAGAQLSFGTRTLWSGLDLSVAAGEFVTVLGANGADKSSLLKAILGLHPLAAGRVRVNGAPARRGSGVIGYVPQQRRIDPASPVRVRDLVRLGIDGARWGIGLPSPARRRCVEQILADTGATELADRPLHLLSGGEQQRVRIAQALVTDPSALLCDEPLLSLDLHHQRSVVSLIERRRRQHGTAVLFVTHEITPVLPFTDRVLYLAGGRFRVGTVEEVMTTECLSELYGTRVEVIRTGSRILVAGAPEPDHDAAEAAR